MIKRFYKFNFYAVFSVALLQISSPNTAYASGQNLSEKISSVGKRIVSNVNTIKTNIGLSGIVQEGFSNLGLIKAHLYETNGGMRIVFMQHQRLGVVTYDVSLLLANATWYLDTRDKLALKILNDGSRSKRFVWNSENPCRGLKHTHCRRIGIRKIAGRKAVGWHMIDDEESDEDRNIWFDVKYGLMLALEANNGGRLRVEHAQFRPLPKKLFEVPEGYKQESYSKYVKEHRSTW